MHIGMHVTLSCAPAALRGDDMPCTRIPDGFVCSFTDYPDETITVRGTVYRFEWSDRFGPVWLRKDGLDRKNQNIPRHVVEAMQRHIEAKKKSQ